MSDSRGRNEAETRRRLIDPALRSAGWTDEKVIRGFAITDGRIIDSGRTAYRGRPLEADYLLEYRPGRAIGVVEAKRESEPAATGVEQALRYARMLYLPFVYATNGHEILEIDKLTGTMTGLAAFPSPEELWERYRTVQGIGDGLATELALRPFSQELRNWDNSPKRPRYYQRLAVDAALQAIASGTQRILLTLATGTGKTFVAFLIIRKLWESSWKVDRKLRVLYLADRNILVDQPKDEYFAPVFADAVHRLGGGRVQRGRNIYFALYQSLTSGVGDEDELFAQYPRDYFDVIIVDECHRGSAAESSNWRRILAYFEPATQLGMTATPIRDDERDTFGYFGNPVYTYSLHDGIRDGFLAPYRVRRVRLNLDLEGWQPKPGQLDKYGQEIPDRVYGPKDWERLIAIIDRTEEAARYLTEHLQATDRMAKTVVFCETAEHAHRMRMALHNLNPDLVVRCDPYVCRITNADGQHGRVLLDEFRRVDSSCPVVVVTARLLSTGVDMPTVRNVVMFRRIASMPEFKQIVGRGTRLFPEAEKLTFEIIDFVEATRLFRDPNFDGPPLKVVRDETDATGHIVEADQPAEDETAAADDAEEGSEQVAEPEPDYETADQGPYDAGIPADTVITDAEQMAQIRAASRKLYVVEGVEVYVWNDLLYMLDSDRATMRLIEYREFIGDRVRSLRLSPVDLRAQWARLQTRRELRQAFADSAIDLDELYRQTGYYEADPIDLLLHLAWSTPLISRSERAAHFRREHRAFLDGFAPNAKEILLTLLDKYEDHGVNELDPGALDVPPFPTMGSVVELAARFGGAAGLHEALDGLTKRLYDTA